MNRSAVDRDRAKKIVALQIPLEKKMKRADYLIDNSGSLVETEEKVKQVYKSLLANLHISPVS